MAGKSITGFQADLKTFARTLEADIGKVRRRIALDLFERISQRTPVVSGRLRASWIMTDGRPARGAAPAGASSYPDRGEVKATFRNAYDVTWIVNNLDYAAGIEFDGHSKQAPAGMVRV